MRRCRSISLVAYRFEEEVFIMDTKSLDKQGKVLHTFKEGDYFGERAILYDEVRSAPVTAASRVRRAL